MHPILATLVALATMVVAWWVGRSAGRRARARGVTTAQFHDASLALLGLLLAFSFSVALQKYDARREAVVTDANTIGDFATCVSLLPEPSRGRLHAAIREYVEVRLGMARTRTPEVFQAGLVKCDRLHAQMTELVGEAIRQGTPVVVPLTNTLNALTSSHAARLAAIRDRLPIEILAVLMVAAGAAMMLVGRSQGIAGDHHEPGTFAFVLVAALLIWVISDLNDPRRGLIRVSQLPLERVSATLPPPSPAP